MDENPRRRENYGAYVLRTDSFIGLTVKELWKLVKIRKTY